MFESDILIIGQGLAGSLLAYFLKKQNQRVLIMDDGHQHCATRVAAGLMDAISGMRLTLAWKADILIPFAKQTYREIESQCSQPFFFDYDSFRFFTSELESGLYKKKKHSPEFNPYYGLEFKTSPFPYISSPYGGVETLLSSALHTDVFLKEMATLLSDSIVTQSFDHNRLTITDSGIQYGTISAKKIIFCLGDSIRFTPWFSHLPYRPAKGETLTISSDTLSNKTILHFGKWLVPAGKNLFKFGATYEWNDLSDEISTAGKKELTDYFASFISTPTIDISQQSGIRCMVKDLRPILGFHPQFPSIGVFGALSSKGVMTAPYYAHQFSEHITKNTPLDPEVRLFRYV